MIGIVGLSVVICKRVLEWNIRFEIMVEWSWEMFVGFRIRFLWFKIYWEINGYIRWVEGGDCWM